MARQSTVARVFDISTVENEIEEALRNAPMPRRMPPPLVDFKHSMMPDYVHHRDGVNQVGALSAEAVVREYEATAKEIEAMGAELKERLDKLEKTRNEAAAALQQIKETAAVFRDAGKLIFLQIEDCAMMTEEVRSTCTSLKAKIAGPTA